MGKLKYYKNKMILMLKLKSNYSNEEIHKLRELENGKVKNSKLDDKVDEFIDWYYKNMVKGSYTEFREFHQLRKMRNLIEKIAVWYELRYPDYEINRIMHSSVQEFTKVDDVMFKNNRYINDLVDENSDANYLDWAELYNAKAFINSLPFDERKYFSKPKYSNLVYLNSRYLYKSNCEINRITAHLELSKNGIVIDSDGVSSYTHSKITDKEVLGKRIIDVINLFKERNIILDQDSELVRMANYAENWKKQKEEMLNCAMYRIIERGGNRYGPRRAFLFAKEFGRNIDIPMMYGIDYSDPRLREFMNEYLKAGGSENLICYENYFFRTNDNEKLTTIALKDMYKLKDNYTDEEKTLYQRMVNALSSQVDYEAVKKEEVKQLRLQRKLDKSRNKN